MPLIIYFMLFTSWTFGNFTELHYNIAEDIVTIQASPQICQQFSFSFDEGHEFLSGRSCCSSSTATGMAFWHVSWMGWWNPFRLFTQDHTGDNLVVWKPDCRVGAATPFIQNLCRHVQNEYWCVDYHCNGGTQFRNFSFCTTLTAVIFRLLNVPALTYLLTPCSRFLLEKLTGCQQVKKFPVFYGTRRFITAVTSVRHLSLS
jgi:hypothetical protein